MTTTASRTLQAFALEPIELAISQPHQFLISSASVSIVALEASTLIPWPFNLALAIGAEWAYLRGLISGSGIKTRWAAALNWSAVLLVVLYGSLWGLRQFHLVPEQPTPIVALLLTAIHIGAIGAVTICSAMLHRVGVEAEAKKQRAADEQEIARQTRLQQERDLIELDKERKRAELELWEAGQAAKMRAQNARTKMRTNARPARANADEKKCPKCGTELEPAKWLAACRWGHCENCKEAS